MRPTMLAVAATLLLMTLALDAASQELATLTPGTRIRVTARQNLGPKPEAGTVISVAGDTLRFASDQNGHEFLLLRGSISNLEVSAGPGSVFPKTVMGSVLGAASGAATAFGIVFIMQQLAPECFVFCTDTAEERLRQEAKDESNRRKGVLIGAAFGAVAGGLIGASHPSERWTKATLLSRA